MAEDSRHSDDEGETESLDPGITDYPVYWGRTYHRYKQGSYPYPNDEIESDRNDAMHHILKQIHGGKLFFAPLVNPQKILDIGTGTGIWPIELADSNLFPGAKIIGTDLSPIQPSNVPFNVSFEIQDCTESSWRRPLASFDYLHCRMLLGGLTSYASFIKIARRYLRPGSGWLECHELLPAPFSDDNSIPEKWPLVELEQVLHKAGARMDPKKPIRLADNIKTWMQQAGYVDIHEHVTKIPISSWAKDKELKKIGKWWAQNLVDCLPAISYKPLSEGLGWNRTETEVFLASVRKAIVDQGVHAYHKMYVVYGRRPSAEEEQQLRPSNEKQPAPAAKGTANRRT